ncbi:hypothetical protein FEM48_Zijuj05G0184700 [Ziziphus jujuba var. spinosa]|uniref:Reverse transcriptase domain-containing protein n=1 Tax=Ziziphus jujuba var. spinosa TaxID=714518 RepID=A0A978VGF6_ZIZJJ|nr:hypothetical protein FEM48_Zijuj05G0184700 [Ziziphus jujuba var. spinosa]
MEANKNIQGNKVSRGAPTISHFLNADDILVSCQANFQNAKEIGKVLNSYSLWLGQAPNSNKSKILFSKNTPGFTKKLIKDTLGFKELKASVLYLGNSLIVGKHKHKDFYKLKERLQGILEGWPSVIGKTPKLKEGADSSQAKRVANLLDPISIGWNISKLQELCDQETIEAISRVDIHGPPQRTSFTTGTFPRHLLSALNREGFEVPFYPRAEFQLIQGIVRAALRKVRPRIPRHLAREVRPWMPRPFAREVHHSIH